MQDTISNSPVAQEIAGKVITAIAESQMEVNWQHIALTIIGAIMYNLMRLNDAQKISDFNWKTWVNKNWISYVLSSLSLVTMFMLKEDLKDMAGFDMSNRLGCFLAGFTCHTFVSMAKSTAKSRFAKANDGASLDDADTK